MTTLFSRSALIASGDGCAPVSCCLNYTQASFNLERCYSRAMVFINIPFVEENKNIDTDVVKRALDSLDISEDAKYEAFQAIYNRKPRGVPFDDKDLDKALTLENALAKLGIPYRQSEISEFS